MAIANTRLSVEYFGNKKVVFGKSVLSGGTNTGDVTLSTLGMKRVDHFSGTVSDALTSIFSVNAEPFPCYNDITIITTNNDDTVYWMAVGVPG
jgi:hypothetical protein